MKTVKQKVISKYCAFIAVSCLLTGSFPEASVGATRGASRPDLYFECHDLGTIADSGGQAEKKAIWKLGKAYGEDREFRLYFDAYSIPDIVKVSYWGEDPNTGSVKKVTHQSVPVAGKVSFPILVSHRASRQEIEVTINPGGGPENTLWEYFILQETDGIFDLSLTSYTGGKTWRKPLYGTNLSRTHGITLTREDDNSLFASRVYRFTCPEGTKAMRVRTIGHKVPGQVYVAVSRGCIPPKGFLVNYNYRYRHADASMNRIWRNTVTFDEHTRPPTGGAVYYIRVTSLISGLYSPAEWKAGVHLGNLEIDCFSGGKWGSSYAKWGTAKRRILVGFESFGEDPAPKNRERLSIVTHGHTDSPHGKTSLGLAARAKYGYETLMLNWSDGANNTGLGMPLRTGEHIVPGAKSAARLLSSFGYRTSRKTKYIDFYGHSLGTYFGYYTSIYCKGKFRRFYALDPANYFSFMPTANISFKKAGYYSMGILGYGRLSIAGSSTRALKADESIVLQGPIGSFLDPAGSGSSFKRDPFRHHDDPWVFMEKLFNGLQPSYIENLFSESLAGRPRWAPEFFRNPRADSRQINYQTWTDFFLGGIAYVGTPFADDTPARQKRDYLAWLNYRQKKVKTRRDRLRYKKKRVRPPIPGFEAVISVPGDGSAIGTGIKYFSLNAPRRLIEIPVE